MEINPKAILLICTLLAVAFEIVRYALKRTNSKRNTKVDNAPGSTTKGKIINDQNGATGDNFRYGAYKASWNACETIAVHNAKVLRGDSNSTLSQTIKAFQDVNAMFGFGGFGSNPNSIGRVLLNSGIDYLRVDLSEMTEQGIYIISFWNDNRPWGGLHTVALCYDGTTYMAYNFSSEDRGEPVSMSYFKNRFICAYYLR